MSNRKRGHSGNLPAQAKKALAQISVTKQELFSGPMPHPDILQKYNDIVPGAAERILIMVEKQSIHRQELEKMALQSRINDSRRGINAGTIVSLAAMCVSGILAFTGHETTAAILVGGNLVSLAGTFIYGTQSNRKEREKLRKEDQ